MTTLAIEEEEVLRKQTALCAMRHPPPQAAYSRGKHILARMGPCWIVGPMIQ